MDTRAKGTAAAKALSSGDCSPRTAATVGAVAARRARVPRVAVVTTVHRWGDPRVFERETASWLDWGCEVHVFVPAAGPLERRAWSEHPGLRLHLLPEPRGRRERLVLALRVAGLVRREGPFDLVHFHDPELIPGMMGLALAWRRTYFLYDVHEELPLEVRNKPWIPAWLRPVSALACGLLWRVARWSFAGFAPATEAIARHWPPERTRILHNYPSALFEPPPGPAPPPDPTRVIYVGGLTEVRGIRPMLEAVREVRRVRCDVRLELYGKVGDPTLAPDVDRAVKEGWCTHVTWLPPEALARTCRGAGVGLAPYQPIPDHLEALPTKLFEYMALGIPILASDFPLWRELVERSGCGRVSVPDAVPLARRLVEMIDHPAALASHAARGRAAYRAAYRWEVECEELRWHLDRALGVAAS